MAAQERERRAVLLAAVRGTQPGVAVRPGMCEFFGVPAEFEACTSESGAFTGEPRGLAFSWRTMAGSAAAAAL